MAMIRHIPVIVVWALGALLLSACDTPRGLLSADPTAFGGGQDSNTGTFVVGENAVGESCRAIEDRELDEANVGVRTVAIYCGDWRSPSGRVIELEPAYAAPGPAAIATSGLWHSDISRSMECGAPTAGQIFGGTASAQYLACEMRQGGWPSIAAVTEVNGRVYAMDGIPAAAPVMEQAAAIMAGIENAQSLAASGSSDSMREFDVLLNGQLFGADDRFRDERLLRVAQYYNAVREYGTSEQKYRELLELRRAFLAADHPGLAEPMLGIALQMSNQQRFVESASMFDAVQPMAAASFDALVEPRYYLYRGMDRGNRGECAAGLDYIRLAGEQLTELADEGGWRGEDAVLVGAGSGAPVELALAKMLEARLLLCLSRPREAEAALNDGYSLLRVSDLAPSHWRSFFESERAFILADLNRGEAGEVGLATAIADRQELFGESRPEAIDMLALGDLQVELGDIDRALSYYREATAILTDRGEGVRAPQIWTYLQLLNRLAADHPGRQASLTSEMFGAGQLVQSPITSQTIQSTAARLASGDQEVSGLIRNLQDVEANIFEVSQRIDIESTRPDGYRDDRLINQLTEQKQELEVERNSLEVAVQSAAPTYNQLLQRPIEYGRVVDILRPGEAIVQILPGFTESFVFFITADGIQQTRLEIGEEEFQRAVSELRLGLVPSGDERLRVYDVELAHAIYRSVLGRFHEDLRAIDHLITIPGGSLTSLPFGILVTEPTAPIYDFDYRGVSFVARDMATSLVPSVRSFADLRELIGESRAPRAFIGFGDFQPAPVVTDTDNSCISRQNNLQANASPLPESAGEIAAAARAFRAGNAPLFTDVNFTEQEVAAQNLSDYRVVYFATHGVMPTDLECELQPALLTSVSAGDPGEGIVGDGFLTASEILTLELDADLIVLSACNTGGGDGQGGESLSGLARSFFYSGARALLVSHWYVESESTVRTMVGMFGELGSTPGLGSAEALRRSQMQILDDAGNGLPIFWSHPLYWGAFTLVGDGERTISPGTSA